MLGRSAPNLRGFGLDLDVQMKQLPSIAWVQIGFGLSFLFKALNAMALVSPSERDCPIRRLPHMEGDLSRFAIF